MTDPATPPPALIPEPPADRRPLTGAIPVHALMDPSCPHSAGGRLGVLDLPTVVGLKRLRDADIVLAFDTATGGLRVAKGIKRFQQALDGIGSSGRGVSGTVRLLSVELDFDSREYDWLLTACHAAGDMAPLDDLPDPDDAGASD